MERDAVDEEDEEEEEEEEVDDLLMTVCVDVDDDDTDDQSNDSRGPGGAAILPVVEFCATSCAIDDADAIEAFHDDNDDDDDDDDVTGAVTDKAVDDGGPESACKLLNDRGAAPLLPAIP